MFAPLTAISRLFARKTTGFSSLLCFVILVLSGCESTSTQSSTSSYPTPMGDVGAPPVENLTLSEGDVILVSFPGAPDLNITQTIRRDGMIDLPLIDEVSAVGKTPDELEALLVQLYEPQLVNSEVQVTVVSSSIPMFVSGSVAQPGKILVSRRITALEAIMEAGGPIMGRSDLKNVTVIREENGVRSNFKLNIKDILDGKPAESFILKASDIVYVPELKF
ncbi:MAG: polysaccharide biosynthesis/export family protein [Opitutaceae bacterium]